MRLAPSVYAKATPDKTPRLPPTLKLWRINRRTMMANKTLKLPLSLELWRARRRICMKRYLFLLLSITLFSFVDCSNIKIEITDLPTELLYYYVISYKNMYTLNRVDRYFYCFIKNIPRYKKRIEKKAEFLCKKNVYCNRFELGYNNFPDFWFKYREYSVVCKENKNIIKKYYGEKFPLLFLKHVRCVNESTKKNLCWRLDRFCQKYPLLLKCKKTKYKIPSSDNIIKTSLYTLDDTKTKQKKKLIVIKNSWFLDCYNYIPKFFEQQKWQKDNTVVRIIFPNVSFNDCPDYFSSYLKDNFLGKPVTIQNERGNTFFHEACEKETIDDIKKYNSCYLDVLDISGNTARTRAQMRTIYPYQVNEKSLQIIKYLVTEQVKQGDFLTKNQRNKLPTKELRDWYKKLEEKL